MTPYLLVKKPVTVQGLPFDGSNFTEVRAFTGPSWFREVHPDPRPGVVAEVFNHQYDEWVPVRVGQWVMRGVVGEFYPVDVDVLHGGYQPPEGGWPT